MRIPTKEEKEQLIEYMYKEEAWRAMASEEEMKENIASYVEKNTDIGITENYEIPALGYTGKVMVVISYTGKQPNKEVYIWDRNGNLREIQGADFLT